MGPGGWPPPVDEPAEGETQRDGGHVSCVNECKEVIAQTGALAIGAIDLRSSDGWRRVKIAVDSGAAESVILAGATSEYPPVQHSQAIYYTTASGKTIVNEGQQVLPIATANATGLRSMTFQACDVTKPLGSVKRIVDAGHAVVFLPESMGGRTF